MTTDPATAALIALATTMFGEATKTWGAYAIALSLLGVMLWLSERRSKIKQAESALLLAEKTQELKEARDLISRLQDDRLKDAMEMIRVAKSGTETMAARTQNDAQLGNVFERFTNILTDIRSALPPTQRRDLPDQNRWP